VSIADARERSYAIDAYVKEVRVCARRACTCARHEHGQPKWRPEHGTACVRGVCRSCAHRKRASMCAGATTGRCWTTGNGTPATQSGVRRIRFKPWGALVGLAAAWHKGACVQQARHPARSAPRALPRTAPHARFGLYEWSPWPWGKDRVKRQAADTLVSDWSGLCVVRPKGARSAAVRTGTPTPPRCPHTLHTRQTTNRQTSTTPCQTRWPASGSTQHPWTSATGGTPPHHTACAGGS
jgi:hypothetical protein